MAIIEEGSNFPTVLGRKTFAPTLVRAQKVIRSIPIANQAIALVRGESPVHLAQRLVLPRQTPGGGSQLPAFNAPGLGSLLGQIKRGNLRTLIRQKVTQRLRGQIRYPQFGIGPLGDTSMPAKPYVRPPQWTGRRNIAELPSITGIISGPERTVLPQQMLHSDIHISM